MWYPKLCYALRTLPQYPYKDIRWQHQFSSLLQLFDPAGSIDQALYKLNQIPHDDQNESAAMQDALSFYLTTASVKERALGLGCEHVIHN
jgi:hypothetical protein